LTSLVHSVRLAGLGWAAGRGRSVKGREGRGEGGGGRRREVGGDASAGWSERVRESADEPITAGERPQLPRVGKSLQRHYQPCRLEHSPATVTFVLTTYLTYSQLRLSRSADPIHAH
jgi:hypothetical protein